jgi:glutathione reductase (NADPH)
MSKTYDLIVIGTGVASSIANQRAAQGSSVAVVDHRDFGGTCALRGCTPKKVLTHTASIADATRRLSRKTLAEAPVEIDWPALMQFKRAFTEATPKATEKGYIEAGIDAYHGRARFVGPQSVAVGDAVLSAAQVVVATGAEPANLPIEGAEHLATSDDFLDLDELPNRLIFVGGGYIAFECAHVAARAGAEVTILHRGERALEGFEPELVDWLLERTRQSGIDVRLEHEVTVVEPLDTGFRVHCGRDRTFDADLVFHSAGRVPALADLDLEAGEVAVENGRLALNEQLQSESNPRVFAAGDAAARGPMLTPVATMEAEVVVANLGGARRRPDYTGVPSVVFSEPPLARVGLSEQAAREAGLDVEVRCESTAGWFGPRYRAEPCAGFKTVVDRNSGKVLGAHLLGPAADEVINLFALAVRHEITADQLRDTVMVFPTAAHDVKSML